MKKIIDKKHMKTLGTDDPFVKGLDFYKRKFKCKKCKMILPYLKMKRHKCK